jgi:hypothetical protein
MKVFPWLADYRFKYLFWTLMEGTHFKSQLFFLYFPTLQCGWWHLYLTQHYIWSLESL